MAQRERTWKGRRLLVCLKRQNSA